MSCVFISYRRDDSGGHARAIYQRLAQRFGPHALFMDVETLKPGRDFGRAIETKLSDARIMLVLIGKDWIGQLGGGGSRLEEAGDFVRLEVSLALQRGIPVVPILLGTTSLPSPSQLPDDLKGLLSFQTVQVTHARFAADMEAIEAVAAEALGVATGWGRISARLRALGRPLRTPEGIYWTTVAAYAMFAAVVLSISQWAYGIEMRRDFGLTQALTLDDMRRGFIRALRDWSWSPSRLLWDEFPSIVLLMLIAVPILHRFRCEGYRRGLVTGFWLHVPWQVLVLLVVAFVTFRTERPAELPGASAQAYASFVGGLVMLGVLFAVRRFVTVQGVLFTLVLLSMILYALVDGARAQEAGATGAAKARHA